MDNRITIAIIIAAILIVGGFIMYNTGPTIQAQGSASIDVVPDIVSVNINVETRNSTAELANEQNKEISEKLLFELVRIGFDMDELKFVNINSYPEYDYSRYGQQTFKGYVVSQQLVVKTTETSKVPKIVDAAISSGALVSYINFEISDDKQNELKAEAMTEASKDAKIKAEAIASGQGKNLGRLVSLQNLEYGGYQPYRYFDAVGMAASSANMEAKTVALDIAPNEQEITANVAVVYKLSRF